MMPSGTYSPIPGPVSSRVKHERRRLPAPETLQEALIFSAETGKLYWRSNGAEAFTAVGNHGYLTGSYRGSARLLAHRVAWAIFTGEWPRDHIDHVNGIKTDNRLDNLRQATRSENMRNMRLRKNNSSGFKGVHWHRQSKKWRASIWVDGTSQGLGLFDTPEDAHAAYCEAARIHFGDFARAS